MESSSCLSGKLGVCVVMEGKGCISLYVSQGPGIANRPGGQTCVAMGGMLKGAAGGCSRTE